MALSKLGKYERVDVLGHGASGIVYLAWDTLLKKQIALKEVDLQAADVSRFLEEARVMDRLSHPNIVHVNGVDRIDGHIVIDMEYVKGQNLQQILRAEGQIPLDRALDIAIQTLDALDYAHRMRTVHRDIKPANILIGRTGEVKLVDFGLAEILATNSYAGGAGTYAYMAPEDFAEEHHSDHQSDIWAVGVTLYEMLTGRRPFNVTKPKDPFAWRRTLLNEKPARLIDSAPVVLADGEDDGISAPASHPSPRENSAPVVGAGTQGPPSAWGLDSSGPGRDGVGTQGQPSWGLDSSRPVNGTDDEQASQDRIFPPALQTILDRALAREKAERYQTAGEFRDDLRALREGRAPVYAVVTPALDSMGEATPAAPGSSAPTILLARNGAGAVEGLPTLPAPGAAREQPEFMLPVAGASAAAPLASVPPRYGEVVPAEEADPQARRRLGLRRKAALPARARVEPEMVHFGALRKGDDRSERVTVHIEGGEGRMTGRVVAAPAWTTVYPPVLHRRRQHLTITAHSLRTWQTGDYDDVVRLETTAGSVEIPVSLRVLKPRKAFSQVAIWFVPLFLSVLLPALTIAWGGAHLSGARYLVPAAALGSGLLSAMLLLVSVEADLGVSEKAACGILLAVMTMVLGVMVGISGRSHQLEGLARLPATGVPIGALFVLQLAQRRYWKFWAIAIAILAVLTSVIFAGVLTAD